MNELHLFAGAGGGILGGHLLGHTCVCAVEIEEYPRRVLLQRQRDGILPRFPVWDDVSTFDGTPWRGSVDVLCGGFPCQDISSAGRGAGITGERSGLWKEYKRLIGEIRPSFVFAENSPLLRTRGLVTVLQDLAELGYDARWGVLGAHHVGAPHKRDRMWVLAYAKELFGNGSNDHAGVSAQPQAIPEPRNGSGAQNVANTAGIGQSGQGELEHTSDQAQNTEGQADKLKHVRIGSFWETEPGVGRVVDGLAARLDSHGPRLKAIGNGQVPAVAALAFRILSAGLIQEKPCVSPGILNRAGRSG